MKTILDVKRRLAAARCPYPVSLMDDLEEAFAEIERLKAEKVELWDCPGCGFTYDACHEDIDPATGEGNGNHTCPVCENVDLERENEGLRKEHEEARKSITEEAKQADAWHELYLKSERSKNVMANYMNELMLSTSNMVIASQIVSVLREAVGREESDPVGHEGEGEQV